MLLQELNKAKELPLGFSKKIPHAGCSDSEAVKISHNEDGFFAYCFKCKQKAFEPHKHFSLKMADQINALKALRRKQRSTGRVELPADCLQPHEPGCKKGLIWLKKYGILDEEIERYGIVFSPSLKRILIPICGSDGKALLDFCGRDVTGYSKMKYFTHGIAKHYYVEPGFPISQNSCVVVEDILSCIKTGRVLPAYAMLGTEPAKEFFMNIKCYSNVLVWSDSDKAGDMAYNHINRWISAYAPDISLTRIRTPNDPKCYSTQTIRSILAQTVYETVYGRF